MRTRPAALGILLLALLPALPATPAAAHDEAAIAFSAASPGCSTVEAPLGDCRATHDGVIEAGACRERDGLHGCDVTLAVLAEADSRLAAFGALTTLVRHGVQNVAVCSRPAVFPHGLSADPSCGSTTTLFVPVTPGACADLEVVTTWRVQEWVQIERATAQSGFRLCHASDGPAALTPR